MEKGGPSAPAMVSRKRETERRLRPLRKEFTAASRGNDYMKALRGYYT
jgi:hypothetical protein